jgi:hypothetical protein
LAVSIGIAADGDKAVDFLGGEADRLRNDSSVG